jgi:prepilin-type N-terminal cleavage/methylation domain-containing protein
MRSKSGFTLVEMVIVIALIAILSGIAIIGYIKVQSNTRDNTRSADVTVITDALERYYAQNGEYPSVRSLVNNYSGNTGTVVAAKLNIATASLSFPRMPSGATNALTSTAPPANDYIVYTASSTVDNTDCQSLITGGCGQYTLQYNPETGSTITITSRHSGG